MLTIEQDAIIPASPEVVYQVIADYRVGHPAILPKQYFKGVEVEKGGFGAGTVITVRMKAIGGERVFRQEVMEPEPGKVLVEKDINGETATTFKFVPVEEGRKTRVVISTSMPVRSGPAGWLEKNMTAWYLKMVYAKELQLLAERAGSRSS